MALSPTNPAIVPASQKQALSTNYLTSFDFTNQYLPDVYEEEVPRFGNRTITGFLKMLSAEMPLVSDQVRWTEQGRLHIAYNNVYQTAAKVFTVHANDGTATSATTTHSIRQNQTVLISDTSGNVARGVVSDTDTNTFTVESYSATGTNGFGVPGSGGLPASGTAANANRLSVIVIGSEFKKGTVGMLESIESEDVFRDNKPVILKDRYAVSGSDTAQIGWVEVASENGANGYYWFLKSEADTRLRFEDYLEKFALEAVPSTGDSNAAKFIIGNGTYTGGEVGSKGLFHEIEAYGGTYTGALATSTGSKLTNIDALVKRFDSQGAIQENSWFLNRTLSLEIDDIIASLNADAGGSASWGIFNNSKDMALQLGFRGFTRGGYDIYKSSWKYLNQADSRALIGSPAVAATTTPAAAAIAAVANVKGVSVPMGSSNVYDEMLGMNAKRPYLHIRYRASETDNRKMKSWITGSVGGAYTSSLDAMEVQFLSERCLVTQAANNFVIFKA